MNIYVTLTLVLYSQVVFEARSFSGYSKRHVSITYMDIHVYYKYKYVYTYMYIYSYIYVSVYIYRDSVLQCVAVCCSVMQCVAVRCSVLPRVAVKLQMP